MFVCICKAVTDKKILEAVEKGLLDIKSVEENCGAGTDCGACRFKVNKLISDAVEKQNSEGGKAEGF